MKRILGAWSACLALTAAAAAQTPAGGEFRVNTYTTGIQSIARTAMEPDGDFVVVWTSNSQDGDGYGVFGQRFAAGGALRGNEFQINTITTELQRQPALAVGGAGDFVVVWTSGPNGPFGDIKGKLFDVTGTPIGHEFQVNASTTGAVYRPRVGRAADGSFVVIWTGSNDGSGYGVVARRFNAAGVPLGAEFVVNSDTIGDQLTGDVAVADNGNFVVAWDTYSFLCSWTCDILGQRYDASGHRLGTEFLVNSYTGPWGNQTTPSISVSPAGGFVVAWNDWNDGSGLGVFARRFDAFGGAVGSDFMVNTTTTGPQRVGQVAHDAHGNFAITWEGPDGSAAGLVGQRFGVSGIPRGPEFRLNTHTIGQQGMPTLASDAVGNFVVAWNSAAQDGSNDGVFAQRFGGLQPAALGVDSPGNQVLEPGETVDVRPSWRNINGSAQTFSGTLAEITGPAGATYTITDGVSDYGAVADGATAPCTDCYAVSVSNPATRPVLHWDASAVESILPDTQGQQKEWRLHIGGSFTDVSTASGFYRFIETLLHHDITSGCGPTRYCPASPTTREQMAVFVLLAKEGAGYVPPVCGTAIPMFVDVPSSSPFCRWVEELARRGVASGCGGGNYCPTAAVSREQMAVFVLRTLDPALSPPACTTPLYNDVPATSGFCRWIEELTRRGVVTGCGGGNYCPTADVTREQMSVFLAVTFGLALYGS